MRRLRAREGLRRLVRETRMTADCLVYPVFVTCGHGVREPITSLPGQYRYSVDTLIEAIQELVALGVGAVLLFGIPEHKDTLGSQAWSPEGVVQRAVRALKERFPELVVITDVCLCEYTSHGHCGLVDGGEVLNDPTLELLGRVAVSHAEAGADVVAPSDMMDGRVQAIRAKLDAHRFPEVPILSYAAKYASAFYGPFREAAGSAPQFGDRSGYQMDPANVREALREIELDLEEGADMILVKPALAYLDVLRQARDRYSCPLGAYNVSGEYAMIKAAAAQGWLEERRAVMEVLTAIRRAGADFIVTYFAKDVARWLAEG
ncbi:MAG: porphobilinogen synthase [Moorellales bacterium]